MVGAMVTTLQGSLLDEVDEPALGSLGPIRRTLLSEGAWIDVLPGWCAGADTLFGRLADAVPWHAERRRMYDRVVDVPRLLKFYDEGEELPDPILNEARAALNRHYAAESSLPVHAAGLHCGNRHYATELGEPFRTAGLCFYRDGRDSVAWHGDTIGRGATEDTMVAILSVGAPRALHLRPRTGSGPTIRRALGHGDLIVMGGSCQRTWEHAVPKTGKPVGPRISIQFRPRGVR